MNNDIVQLTDKSGNNIYPIAGGATQDSISKSMLAEGVFEGPELFPSPNEAYVRTANIVDGAVTSDKIDWTTLRSNLILETPTLTINMAAGSTQTLRLDTIFSDWHTIVANRTVVSCLVVPTGGGSGASFDYHFQGVGGSLAQIDYGVSITNLSTDTAYNWTYKIIITLM